MKKITRFTQRERNMILRYAAQYKDIIENKRTDAESNRKRDEVWHQIAKEFNARVYHQRSAKQLRQLYKNMKLSVKKDLCGEDKGNHRTFMDLLNTISQQESTTQYISKQMTVNAYRSGGHHQKYSNNYDDNNDDDDESKKTRAATTFLFKIFLLLGLLKPQKWKALYHVYAAFMNLNVCFISPILFTLSYFFERNKMNTSQLLTSLQVAINVCVLPAKFITVFMSMRHRQQHAIDLMDILDARCQRPDEYEIIRRCGITGNRLTLFYLILYSMYSSSTFLTSVISGQPPYSLYMPMMDWRNSTAEFATQSLIEYSLMNLSILHQVGYDAYAVIYVYIIRTHMKILAERVRRLGSDANASNGEHYERLVLCIKDHKNILSLLETIRPIISVTMFTQFVITAFILGTTLINILIFADTNAQIASAIYIAGVLSQSTPCCYQATCLISDSEQLSLAIFNCKWLEKDKRFRKMMIFFMMRSQTPMTLTAMKLFPIQLSTSLGIVKFSFSLYTLIKQMDFGQNLKN